MLYFRLSRLAALLVIVASIARAALTHDATRWSFSLFLIYCGLLVATIAKYAQENLKGQSHYHRFGALLLFTSLSLYLTYGFHSILTFAAGWVLSGWGAGLLIDHFGDARSGLARNKVARYFLIGDLSIFITAFYCEYRKINLFESSTAPVFLVVLLALAGVIRSGAFPFHRWLALTNEAPSPLSALLHAGVVNGLGLMLLSFPALKELRLPIVILCLLTIFFSLVMMRHRHDEKGKLANGTSMQMAYMAIEGSLGLSAAVLLHIIGHGSYKSWSFLRVGGVPSRWKKNQELYLPEHKGGALYNAFTNAITVALLGAVVALALASRDSALTLVLLTISLTSYLLFVKRLAPKLFLPAIGFAIAAVGFLFAETYGLSRLLPSHPASRFALGCVAVAVIVMTLAIRKIPYHYSLKLSTMLMGVRRTPRIQSTVADSNSTLVNEISKTLERYSKYFEPGLSLSNMVAQDPVPGLHSLSYQGAAQELARFGISSYPQSSDSSGAITRNFSRAALKAIDQASWWSAEASHNISKISDSTVGPYTLWRSNSPSGMLMPSDPLVMLSNYVASSNRDAKDVLAALIGCDLGWYQYFLGKHISLITELLALRAALFTVFSAELSVGVGVSIEPLEKSLRSQEEAEVTALMQKLADRPSQLPRATSNVAMVMCIDVRSEKMRRVLESRHGVATLGFAGFFGADISIVTQNQSHSFENQMCPLILKPSIQLNNNKTPQFKELISALWGQANRGSGALAMAEGFGLLQLALNLRNTFAPKLSKNYVAQESSPIISDEAYLAIPFESKVHLARTLMSNLPLDSYAEVIFVGHESGVPNNPFTSLYECGACGGNSGLVNAYYAAKLLNDSKVMSAAGFAHCSTSFGYAMHNTTHQTIHILAGGPLTSPLAKDHSLTQRTKVREAWWQAFPEFGLTGNVGAIIAPRALTAHLDLNGKYFLHDYDSTQDTSGAKLASILAGPGQVMQMINSQYNLTVCDPANFSAGDKTRLNVFTQAGALAGAGGALKRGMPWQAIGLTENEPLHQPIRLQIFIAAPQELINSALAQTPLAELVANGWIAVHALNYELNKI